MREIRTPEPLLTVTDFPDQPLQPLEHHSKFSVVIGADVWLPSRFSYAKVRCFFETSKFHRLFY